MSSHPLSVSAQRLERVILLFLGLAMLSLVVVYLIEPSIYATTLGLEEAPNDRYPWATTLLLLGILGFVACVIAGVRRHWRWLFWVLWLAFGSAILEIPATLLQLTGVLPGHVPLWYSLYRMGIALGETGIAVWMAQVFWQAGVWGMGGIRKQRRLHVSTAAGVAPSQQIERHGKEDQCAHAHQREVRREAGVHALFLKGATPPPEGIG